MAASRQIRVLTTIATSVVMASRLVAFSPVKEKEKTVTLEIDGMV
jgi:hypothetical protein